MWLVVMFAIDMVQRSAERRGVQVVVRRPALSGALAGAGLSLIILYSGSSVMPFIYFQF